MDGDGTTGEATDDDAWDFGDAWTHPVLKFGGANTARQVQLLPGNPPTFSGTVPDATLDNGAAIDPITVPAATVGDGSAYTYAAAGCRPGWCSTPTAPARAKRRAPSAMRHSQRC